MNKVLNIVKFLVLFFLSSSTTTVFALELVESEMNGSGGVEGIDGANAVAVSYDDKQVYVTGYYSDAIAVFNRSAVDGRLTFSQAVKNSQLGEGLLGVFSIAVAPDDNHVYIVSPTGNYVTVFTRADNGTLSVGEVEKSGVNAPTNIAFSVDNLRAYVTNGGDNSLSVFQRDINTGFLTLLQTKTDGVNSVDGLAGAKSVVVDETSQFIYVASKTDHAVAVFKRAAEELQFVQAYKNGAGGISGLRGAIDIVISPDNQYIYVLSSVDNSIVTFSRQSTTGQLTFLEKESAGSLSGPNALTLSPDGTRIYVADTDNSNIAIYERNINTGLLTFKNSFKDTRNLGVVMDVAVNGNGENLYSAALSSDAVSVFNTISTDLELDILDVPSVAIESQIEYVMTITNHGPSQATEIIVTDTVPSGASFISANPDVCSLNTTVLTCTIGSLSSEASETLIISMSTPSEIGSGFLTNTAVVTGAENDEDLTNNTSTINTILSEGLNSVNIGVSISALPNPMNMNSPLNYKITVNNTGEELATNVRLTHVLPADVIFNNSTPTCTFNAVDNTIACTVGDLASGQSTDITVNVTTPTVVSDQQMDFSAQVIINETDGDSDLSNNSVTVTTTVSALEIELAVIDAVATPNSVRVGTPIAVRVDVLNNWGASVSNVKVHSNLPLQLTLASSASGCVQTVSVITCDIGTMEARSTKSLEMAFNTILSGEVPLTFTISGNGTDIDSGNDSNIANITVTGNVADITLAIQDDGPVLVNTALTYTIDVTNNGPGTANVSVRGNITGGNATVTDVLPSGLCEKGRQFSCRFIGLGSGQKQTITVTLTPTQVDTVILTLLAEVDGDIYDPTLPNTASKETAVSNAEANIGVTATAYPSPALVGSVLTYTVVVENSGILTASDVQLSYTVPVGFEFDSANATQGNCVEEERVVTCALGPLNKDGTATILITVLPQSIGAMSSVFSVSSATLDTTVNNNSTTVDTIVSQNKANISVTMTSSADLVFKDDSLMYTLMLGNAGPDMSTGISMTSTLPEGMTFESGTVSPNGSCAESSGIITCTIAGLLKDASATMTLHLSPSTVGEKTVVVDIVGKEFDENMTNNTATVVTQVNPQPLLFFVESLKNMVNGITGLNQPNALTLTSDGQHVYVANFGGGAIAIFRRNSENTLTFVKSVIAEGDLSDVSDVAASPDGRSVYVTHFSDSALSVFSRNADTGELSFVKTYTESQEGVQGLGSAYAVTATNDSVYVAGVFSNAIAVFNRNADTGILTFVEVQESSAELPLESVNVLTLSPDGAYLLAAATLSDSLVVFRRDSATGRLTPIQTLLKSTGDILGLENITSVMISEDGNSVYVTGDGAKGSLLVFRRSNETGQLAFLEVWQEGVSGVHGLSGASSVAIGSQGDYVYVTSMNNSSISIFSRDAITGRLIFVDELSNGENGIQGLSGARALVMNPSGTYLYVIGFSDNSVTTLRTATSNLSVSIQDSVDPVQMGEDLTYTISIANTGIDTASDILLTTTFSNNLDFQTASEENCTFDSTARILTCPLGGLPKDATKTVTLDVTAVHAGQLTVTATVESEQADSDVENNTDVETTDSLVTADIALDVRTDSDLVEVALEYSYFITVSNAGPEIATNIQVVSVLPSTVTFVSAQVDTVLDSCVFDEVDRTVTCSIEQIRKDGNTTIILVVNPNESGIVENTVTATGQTLDTVPANNRVTHSVQVALNIIDQMIDNTGNVLHSYSIQLTGGVSGGDLSGMIINRGLILNAHILPETRVDGGKFGGNINNEGLLENPQLLSGAVINGGIVQGNIRGFPTAPARINSAHIGANSQLNHVIIGKGTTLELPVLLGKGVRFEDNANIPQGFDLTPILPQMIDSLGYGTTAVDLSTDVLLGDQTILEMINALPEVETDFIQLKTGQILQANGDKNVVLMPIRVSQQEDSVVNIPGVTISANGSTTFITEKGRIIFTQPSVQDFSAFQEALDAIHFDKLIVQENGNVRAESLSDESRYGIARPSRESAFFDETNHASQFVPYNIQAALRFTDEQGKSWHQEIYSFPAYPLELQSVLNGIPAVESVAIHSNGQISIRVSGLTRTYLLDYFVKKGNGTSRAAQFHYIDDRDNDGTNDAEIIYNNGDQQVLFLIPSPNLVEDISAIARLQSEGYAISQKTNGDLLFELEGTRLQVRPTSITQLSEDTPTRMDINDDGSMILVTETGLEILAQPVIQDFTVFQDVLTLLGLQEITVKNNGNLLIPVNDTLSFSIRPDSKSTLADESSGIGLSGLVFLPEDESRESSFLISENPWTVTFYDETGAKRQQSIYPASDEPEELLAFLRRIPEIETAIINGDGTLEEISDGALIFKGIFGYELETINRDTDDVQLTAVSDSNDDGISDFIITYESGEAIEDGTEGIEFMSIPDANADGLEDSLVIYSNGNQQIIYQQTLNTD